MGELLWAKMPPEKRYSVEDNGCWRWRGCIRKNGYGKLKYRENGRVIYLLAHRWFYERHKGALPPAKPHVCHTCDNKYCVNPEHLYAGDDADNSRDFMDRVGKGRLSVEQIAMIRDPTADYRTLPAHLGITERQFYKIRRGDQYKHERFSEERHGR